MNGTNSPFLTMSWDDGASSDMKLGDILAKHEISATFYVPCHNSEGRAVLSHQNLNHLAKQFEIGGHTLDHRYLTGLSIKEAQRQIVQGKNELEEILGQETIGFCYPGGRHNASIRKIVQQAGFTYARTIEMFRSESGNDLFQMPTSAQFYPHQNLAFFRNYLKHGKWVSRRALFFQSLGDKNFFRNFEKLVAGYKNSDNVFHLWGHSWEIEELGLWGQFEELCRLLADLVPLEKRLTNADIAKQLIAHKT